MRSSLIGTTIGIIPATGASIAAFIGYGAAKRASKTPEEFGKGCYEGVAASEAANSSVAGADLIPTLTLGIPGGASAAILMGAFIAQGLRPGPMLFQEHASTIYAIFTLLLLGKPHHAHPRLASHGYVRPLGHDPQGHFCFREFFSSAPWDRTSTTTTWET